MAVRTNPSAEEFANREIVATRIVDVPREFVFKAFSDPDHLVHWWGPQGFTNTFQEFDLRPGGMWRFVMHGPDGVNYENECAFVEIAEPERIVFEHLEPIHRFQMTITFDDLDSKTRLTWRMRFDSDQECARVKQFVTEANEQNFDRLAEHLTIMERTPASPRSKK